MLRILILSNLLLNLRRKASWWRKSLLLNSGSSKALSCPGHTGQPRHTPYILHVVVIMFFNLLRSFLHFKFLVVVAFPAVRLIVFLGLGKLVCGPRCEYRLGFCQVCTVFDGLKLCVFQTNAWHNYGIGQPQESQNFLYF